MTHHSCEKLPATGDGSRSTGRIAIREDYILVEPREFSYYEIIRLFHRLTAETYRTRPHIWVFGPDLNGFSIGDIPLLSRDVAAHLPRGLDGHRSALVARSAFHRAILESYIAQATDQPVAYRTFASLEDAEAWVREPTAPAP